MNGNEEPVEIEVEPEIHDILPFDDFCIDQYSNYSDDTNVSRNGHLQDDQSKSQGNIQVKSYQQLASKEFIYKCTVCRETCESGKELLRHVRTHTRHLNVHRNQNERKFKCCICSRSFDDFDSLRSHEETQHAPPFRCRFCNSFFIILKFYKSHLKQHAQQQQKQINSRVPEQKQQQQQKFSHHNFKQSQQSSGSKHFYTASPRATMAMAVQNLSNKGLLAHLYGSAHKPLTCKYCNKSFGKFSVLRKHEMLHKMNNINNNDPENKTRSVSPQSMVTLPSDFNVNKPQSSSSSALTLTPSLLSNLNKLANLQSSESSDGKKPAILININTNDSSSSTPKVETAKKSQEMPLNSSSGLMISSVASIDKNYLESMEKIRKSQMMKNNVNDNNAIHSNNNNASNTTVFIQNGKKAVSLADLQCPICKKIVSQPFSLKVHLRTHTLEKPYSCPICQKSFSQSCNLKTHMNIHTKQQLNQQSNSQPYMCNICKRTFLKASSLNTHMITHTAKLFCYACTLNFDDDAIAYSHHMQTIHHVTMTKDLISRAKANLQKSESQHLQQLMNKSHEDLSQEYEINESDQNQQMHQKLMEVFKVQSSSVSNGSIPKLKITIKKEPVQEKDGNESDSSSSSSSSDSSNSSSSSDSSSSTTSSNSNEKKIDNN